MYLTADGRQMARISRPADSVLIIDDELALLEMLQTVISTFGYEVTIAADVDQAERILTRQGTQAFQCVITDYKMPGKTGLELLRWLQNLDRDLSIVVNTGYASHEDVSAMIREGAVDVLRKPVRMDVLGQAIAYGVKQTRQRRHRARAEQAVKQVGVVQGYMLRIMGISQLPFVDFYSRPMHQAGGDFVSCYPRPDGSHLIVLADVAGHNLDAAYISAYFHGVVHGMVRGNLGPAAIMQDLNQFLLEKWNDRDLGESLEQAPEASVCALFLEVPASGGRVTYHNNGVPPPLLTTGAGESRKLGVGNTPLGLYDDPETDHGVLEHEEGAAVIAWSDGLESLAIAQRVTPEAAACRLLGATDPEREELLVDADDDILVVRVHARGVPRCPWIPIVCESYRGNRAPEIDAIEDSWARSLHYAIPTLPDERLYALLLTGREALLNALNHGCGRNADLIATVHMHYDPLNRALRLMIADPGPGHDDNFLTDPDPDLTKERHSGLVLIRNFPDRIWTARKNAVIYAEFTWS